LGPRLQAPRPLLPRVVHLRADRDRPAAAPGGDGDGPGVGAERVRAGRASDVPLVCRDAAGGVVVEGTPPPPAAAPGTAAVVASRAIVLLCGEYAVQAPAPDAAPASGDVPPPPLLLLGRPLVSRLLAGVVGEAKLLLGQPGDGDGGLDGAEGLHELVAL